MDTEKIRNVFIPGALPTSTYITRVGKMGFTYEDRLKQALSMNGYLTSISGPSKIGKTVLCEKVIGVDNLIEVSGSDFEQKNDFWEKIAKKAGMPIETEITNGNVSNDTIREYYKITKDSVIDFYKQNNLVLLLDDFHYTEESMQKYIAQQFKDAIRKGLKVIIASLPHRSDDSIRTNPDLQGRICIIDIEPWTKDELKKIPLAGFKELEVQVSDDVISKLAEESICSPHLMQLICLSVCIMANNQNPDTKCIPSTILKRAFKYSTTNFDYQNISFTIKQGKNSRGKSRKQYQTKSFGKLDLYGLILEAIAIDPPFSSIDFADLTERISNLISDEVKPTSKSLREYLKNLQDVLDSKERAYNVIEWKDNTLYILEPLFLFYLRWGRE